MDLNYRHISLSENKEMYLVTGYYQLSVPVSHFKLNVPYEDS